VFAGALAGAALAFPQYIAPCEYFCFGGVILAGGMTLGAAAGGLIGSVIGTGSPGRKWSCVPGAPCKEW